MNFRIAGPVLAAIGLSAAMLGLVAGPFGLLSLGGSTVGWLTIVGFGLTAVGLYLNPTYPTTRQRLAQSVYMMVAGLSVGLPHVWVSHPTWFESATSIAFLAAVGWFLIETWMHRRVP